MTLPTCSAEKYNLSNLAAQVYPIDTFAAYLDDTPPEGEFIDFEIPTVMNRDNASCDIILQFEYEQGEYPCSGFLLFYNMTGAESSLSDPCFAFDAKPGDEEYTVVIPGVNPTTYYSCAVAPYSITLSGRTLGSMGKPESWQNFQPMDELDYKGLLDGNDIDTIVDNADDGHTAFNDTYQYRNDGAPDGEFISLSEPPTVLERDNASCDIVLQFEYEQGDNPASAFLLLYNLTGAANAITDAAYLVDARPGDETYTVIIAGVNPKTYYSCAIVPFAVTMSGRTLGTLTTASSWQHFQPGTEPDFKGNLNGTAVTTVVSGAANGQTAFNDTAQYRGDLPPSNYPVLSTMGAFPLSTGAMGVGATLGYTQGTNIATHLAIFVKRGGGTPSIGDPHYLIALGTSLNIELPVQLAPDTLYSIAFGALAMTKSGPQFNSTLAGIIDSGLLDGPVTIGREDAAVQIGFGSAFSIHIPSYLYNAMGVANNGDNLLGEIDFNTYHGIFKPRVATYTTGANHPDMAIGECMIGYYIPTSKPYLFYRYSTDYMYYWEGTEAYY
jgi:hypothetical protein